MSPSSRRAWIEIGQVFSGSVKSAVALLAEGVDRNFQSFVGLVSHVPVALLAEGVDRNMSAMAL